MGVILVLAGIALAVRSLSSDRWVTLGAALVVLAPASIFGL